MREPGSGTRNVLERALEARNLRVRNFRRVTELGSLNLIKALVCAGAGISFFYQPVVQRELESGLLREIPLEDCSISMTSPSCGDGAASLPPTTGSCFAAAPGTLFSAGRRLTSAGENLHNRGEHFQRERRSPCDSGHRAPPL